MIISVNLSKGALAMSKKGVIVKRLASIQNFGSMDVLMFYAPIKQEHLQKTG